MIRRFKYRFTVVVLFVLALLPPADSRASTGVQAVEAHGLNALIKVEKNNYFTLESDLVVSPEGLAVTREGTVSLHGKILHEDIESILVNNVPAIIDRSSNSWSFNFIGGSKPLNRGVNRIIVQAFTGDKVTRNIFAQRSIDIFLDTGSSTEKSGAIESEEFPKFKDIVSSLFEDRPWYEVRWPAAMGPYHITADVIIPEHYRLVIEPGATLFFDENTQLIVHGELIAAGTEFDRIRMRNVPGLPFKNDIRPELKPGPPRWGGIQFRGSKSSNNLISRTDIEYAQTPNGSIGVHKSRLRIDDVSFFGTHQRMIFTDSSSLIIENCIFRNMFADDEFPIEMTPSIDNDAEQIKGVGGIPKNGHYIIRNNYFGTNKGHNDVIDVDSNQYPAPILQILNNYFAGSGDEAIDGGGDFLVEGNIFRNFKKDRDNNGDGEANAISTGDTLNTVVVITRNLFIDIDHVVNFKRGAYGYFENNTVVGITQPHWSLDTDPPPRLLDFSVLNFLIPDRVDPINSAPRDRAGLGAYVSGNIFVDIPQTVFGHPDSNPTHGEHKSLLEVHHSLVEMEDQLENANHRHDRKFSYIVGKPEFVDRENLDFKLQKESPGFSTGPNGLDMGAMVASGASISGEPDGVTGSNQVTLTIGGPGIFSFTYKINDGPWSQEISIANPRYYKNGPVRRTTTINLSNLADGEYTVYVRGRNFAGELQSENLATISKSWIVKSVPKQ